ncbi:MAG TPA: SIR2 family protein, partial [Ilumatobacteraceae bacterium]|nr:SIR2 family protein [Ilumatobacteraceae bacterium]
WPASVFDKEPDYAPSAERPLVFHTFGALSVPESLVLTQDDFDDFQIAVAENRAIIPTAVQRVLANSAITMLGFQLEQRDVRVLLRSLIAQEGAQKLDKFTHVAAQLELGGGVTAPARAQRYMERYFAKFRQPSIDLFWGTVEEFSADLAELWAVGR